MDGSGGKSCLSLVSWLVEGISKGLGQAAMGCPAAWSSSYVSGSGKVSHQGEPGRLCVGDQAWLPSSGEALHCLQLHPGDLLLSSSWLWEWWQTSDLIQVVDLLSLSIHSSNAAAASRAHQWASLALASSHSPEVPCLSLWEALSQWWDGWALVGSSSPLPPGCSPLLHLRQSFKEDKMSLITSCT